jgi:hypothetical protein
MLKDGHGKWLELDQRYFVYHDFGGVPEQYSQGWFIFGTACAKEVLKEAKVKVKP